MFKFGLALWTRAVALLTSIFLPSTIEPCNFSLASSASNVDAKVTNPNPYLSKLNTFNYINTSVRGSKFNIIKKVLKFIKNFCKFK